MYIASEFHEIMRSRFSYFWGWEGEALPGTSIPELELISFEDREKIQVGELELVPIAFPHGPFRSFGFRTGDLAVVVDAKSIPELMK